MFLVNYSSSSESADEDNEKNKVYTQKIETTHLKKTALPKASTLLGKRKLTSNDDTTIDDPSLHQGRIRSFKHERGNWATYVFVAIPFHLFEDLQDVSITFLKEKCTFKRQSQLHISLSKTVVLPYHFIDSFVKNLEEVLGLISSYLVSFSHLKVYANAERTRTFLAITVDEIHLKKMLEILSHIDQVMQNFKLSTFYEDPSFHISLLWCVGDHVDLINQQLPLLAVQLKEFLPIQFKIEKVQCKSGFKEFNFELK